MLEITILGCGSSLGVPVIGCNCTVCKSGLSYNKRSRSAILIEGSDTKIIADFGFDIRDQLLKAGVTRLDGAILTHDHADHVSGIDNLRVFSFIQGKSFDIYTDHSTAVIVEERYKYLFSNKNLTMNPVGFFENFNIKNLNIQLFRQNHGRIDSLGIRVGDFVYSSDVIDFPAESRSFLSNIKTWVIDCLDYKTGSSHAGLDRILEWNEEFAPAQMFLTNMHHNIDYFEVQKHLPKHIIPLYDGQKLTV